MNDVNDFSIGIELVNSNSGLEPYPPPQLVSLKALIQNLAGRHPITSLVTHSEIAEPFGRKSDPKNFPAEELESLKHVISNKTT